jgi:ubiquinone/menaquinone biosynthesis C-methylase UbiE
VTDGGSPARGAARAGLPTSRSASPPSTQSPPAAGSGEASQPARRTYARLAPRYDARWARYVRGSTEATARRLGPVASRRLLDVGCGTGALLKRLRAPAPPGREAGQAVGRAQGRAVRRDSVRDVGHALERGAGCHAGDAVGTAVGCDLTPEMLAVARAELGAAAPLVAADVHALPFGDAAFDLVASVSALHLWARPDRALGEIARAMAPGAELVVTDWCDDFLACRLCDWAMRLVDASHRRAYGTRKCRALLETAGLSVLSVERYRIGWLWGLMTVRARRPAAEAAGGPGGGSG